MSVSALPELSFRQGTFRGEWPPPALVRVDIDHIADARSGEVAGEVSVYSMARELPELLHASRLSLTSVRAREDLARYLKQRTPGEPDLDWRTMVEASAVHAVQAFRRGEPGILLRDVPRPVADRHLLPWALADEMALLFGDGGDGKSMLALATAAAIASGRADVVDVAPTERRRVGYFDWEASGADHRDRLERICGPDMPAIVYVRCDRPLVGELDRLLRIVQNHDLEYLVIDSAAYACDGPPEAAEVASTFARAVRRLGVGTLVVAHVNRAGDDSRPFGSQFWHNNARATWNVKRSTESSEKRLTVGLYNRKANSGPRAEPIGLDFDFGPERTTIRRADVHDVQDLAERIPLKARMLRALRSGPRTYVDLAKELEADVDSVSKAARRGEGRVFTRVPGKDGIYRVALLETRQAA